MAFVSSFLRTLLFVATAYSSFAQPPTFKPTRAPTMPPTPSHPGIIVFVCSDDCGVIAKDITQQSLLDQLGPQAKVNVAGGDVCQGPCFVPSTGRRLQNASDDGLVEGQLSILNIVAQTLNPIEILDILQNTLPGTISEDKPPATVVVPTAAPTIPSSPSTSPTGLNVCEDTKASVKFDYVSNGREQIQRSCRFIRNTLRGSPTPKRRRRKLCEEEATLQDQTKQKIWSLCPRACQICPDQCKDKRARFTIGNNPKKRKCVYLERYGKIWRRQLCASKVKHVKARRKVLLSNICEEICGKNGVGRCSPLLEPAPTSAPTDAPVAPTDVPAPTDAPIAPTDAPVAPTDAPAPTDASVAPTDAPFEIVCSDDVLC